MFDAINHTADGFFGTVHSQQLYSAGEGHFIYFFIVILILLPLPTASNRLDWSSAPCETPSPRTSILKASKCSAEQCMQWCLAEAQDGNWLAGADLC